MGLNVMPANHAAIIRKNNDLTVAEAAALVAVTPRQWHRWEDGTRGMPQRMHQLFALKVQEGRSAARIKDLMQCLKDAEARIAELEAQLRAANAKAQQLERKPQSIGHPDIM